MTPAPVAAAPKFAVVVFPGSNCDRDCTYALGSVLKYPTIEVWHQDEVPADVDAIVIPGGFSYGDALRVGALAAMSPVMQSVRRAAEAGKLVLGVCNGFQVLVETGLLPGALMKNTRLRFACKDVFLKVERNDTPFTSGYDPGEVIRLPIAHGFGNYYAPPEQLAELEGRRGVLFRYCDRDGNVTPEANPNGSLNNIAGVMNQRTNVLGLMPHPERAAEGILHNNDGARLLQSMAGALAGVSATRKR